MNDRHGEASNLLNNPKTVIIGDEAWLSDCIRTAGFRKRAICSEDKGNLSEAIFESSSTASHESDLVMVRES